MPGGPPAPGEAGRTLPWSLRRGRGPALPGPQTAGLQDREKTNLCGLSCPACSQLLWLPGTQGQLGEATPAEATHPSARITVPPGGQGHRRLARLAPGVTSGFQSPQGASGTQGLACQRRAGPDAPPLSTVHTPGQDEKSTQQHGRTGHISTPNLKKGSLQDPRPSKAPTGSGSLN